MPWHVPARFFDLYPREKISLPIVKDADLDDVPPIGRGWALSPPAHKLVTSRDQWRDAVRGYLAAISYCDSIVGKIIASIRRNNLLERTVVVLWGDNGFHLGEKLHWRKSTLWEEATRVPLIIVPAQSTTPVRIHAPVSLVDLFPTLLDFAAIPASHRPDGKSLKPLIANPGQPHPAPLMTWEKGNHSVRTERWRYISYRDGREELYDHQVDPFEWSNLAATDRYDDVLCSLRARLPREADEAEHGKIVHQRAIGRATGIDFLGIGTQKAETTWLYERLREHPQIHFPGGKELHDWDAQRPHGASVDRWLNAFPADPFGRKQGALTPAYAILNAEVIAEIAAMVPDLRLFFALRNPIERAWSSALMALGRAEMTIEDASSVWFLDHFESAGSRRRGAYADCIRRWRSAFPAEQLHLIITDDIAARPAAVLDGLCRHLEIDPALTQSSPEKISERVFAGPRMDLPETLLKFLKALYRWEIEDLSRLIHRDLSHWLAWDGKCGEKSKVSPAYRL